MKIYRWWIHLELRYKFYQWLVRDSQRKLNGDVPGILHFVYYCLFPVSSFHEWLHSHEGYQPKTASWLIYGMSYSDLYFKMMSKAAVGDQFTMVKESPKSFKVHLWTQPDRLQKHIAELEDWVHRLTRHSAALGLYIIDEERFSTHDSWRSLPESIQAALNEATVELKRENDDA